MRDIFTWFTYLPIETSALIGFLDMVGLASFLGLQ